MPHVRSFNCHPFVVESSVIDGWQRLKSVRGTVLSLKYEINENDVFSCFHTVCIRSEPLNYGFSNMLFTHHYYRSVLTYRSSYFFIIML